MSIIKQQIQADPLAYRYLETDGSGSFIAGTVSGCNSRNDDSLFTLSLKAPIKRYKLVQKFDEQIIIDGTSYQLSSQSYVNNKRDTDSRHYLLEFNSQYYPQISYQVMDVTIIKKIVFADETKQVAVSYELINPFNRKLKLVIKPELAGHELGTYKTENEYDYQLMESDQVVHFISTSGVDIHIKSNSEFIKQDPKFTNDYYYSHDSRDGRDSIGSSMSYGQFEVNSTDAKSTVEFIISSENKFEYSASELIDLEVNRKKRIIYLSNTPNQFAERLALATDNYLVDRKSTGEKTIIAGYPFFGDWGRDTFWAFNGVCLQTNRFAEAKSILRSFISYEQNGLIPNMFPEADEYPFYNSVDAPLLFINSVYEYYLATSDKQFLEEVKPTIENMINSYINGTDYHIKMDDDGLITSGADLEQLTWMDVRFDTILPTPRQGKCVEINAMWYNALKIVEDLELNHQIRFDLLLEVDTLSNLVRLSFNDKFKMNNGYLKDVISGKDADTQIRSNAIWAITQNFSPLELSDMKTIVKIASEHLYTSLGIRTLAPIDPEFKPIYGDSHFERDMAYHQGTVWPFILGGYIRAYLKSEEHSATAKENAKLLLKGSENSLNEYCLGQISEVLDGLNPSYSKGCYAQAWSIAEIYRALLETEE